MSLRDGLAVLALVLVGLAVWQWVEARQSDAEVLRLENVRDSLVEVADSSAAAADSAKRERDLVRDSLGAVTDSLERAEARLAAEREDVSGDQVAVGDSLEATLSRLRGAVRTPLVGVVDTALAQHQRERALDRAEDTLYEQQLAVSAQLLETARDSADTWRRDWKDEHQARLDAEQASAAKDSLIAELEEPDPLELDLPFGLKLKPCVAGGLDTRGQPNAVAGACIG